MQRVITFSGSKLTPAVTNAGLTELSCLYQGNRNKSTKLPGGKGVEIARRSLSEPQRNRLASWQNCENNNSNLLRQKKKQPRLYARVNLYRGCKGESGASGNQNPTRDGPTAAQHSRRRLKHKRRPEERVLYHKINFPIDNLNRCFTAREHVLHK
jgi:hypothetical protein